MKVKEYQKSESKADQKAYMPSFPYTIEYRETESQTSMIGLSTVMQVHLFENLLKEAGYTEV